MNFWVDLNKGSDETGDGTEERPFKTREKAEDLAYDRAVPVERDFVIVQHPNQEA